jgi:hypothetical protein
MRREVWPIAVGTEGWFLSCWSVFQPVVLVLLERLSRAIETSHQHKSSEGICRSVVMSVTLLLRWASSLLPGGGNSHGTVTARTLGVLR